MWTQFDGQTLVTSRYTFQVQTGTRYSIDNAASAKDIMVSEHIVLVSEFVKVQICRGSVNTIDTPLSEK